jgi:hypothetical protein
LAALGTRIRTRWLLEPWDRDALKDFLDHGLDAAGAPHLMTEGLKETLVEHAAGNLRVLCSMGDELVHHGALKKVAQLDEQLYVELFGRTRSSTGSRNARRDA